MAKKNDGSKESKETFEVEQSEPQQDVSPDYLIVMERQPQTLYPVAADKSIFVTAEHPGMAEDDITAAMLPISWETPGQARGRGRKQAQSQEEQMETITVRGSIGTARGFVEKCRRQITDFRLSVFETIEDKKKKVGSIRKYDSKNHGDNRSNREVYEHILTATQPLESLGERSFWDVVEGFLDSVAGRESDVAEDFDDLKKELPQLVSNT